MSEAKVPCGEHGTFGLGQAPQHFSSSILFCDYRISCEIASGLVFLRRTMLAAHADIGGATPDTLHPPMSVPVFAGGCLKTTVAIGCGTAVNTAPFIMVVLMKSVETIGTGTAPAISSRTAMNTF